MTFNLHAQPAVITVTQTALVASHANVFDEILVNA